MHTPIFKLIIFPLLALTMSVACAIPSLAAPAPDTAQTAMARAVAAEVAENWNGAAAAYHEASQAASAENTAAPSPALQRLAAEAERSFPLMTSRAKLGAGLADGGPAYFLGVDHTIGSDWQGTIGTEGWILFADHADDFAGGPRLLDHSFAYRVRSGEAGKVVFRWCDAPVTHGSNTLGDTPLADPAAAGDHVVSFLNDGGESWTADAGPDLYIDLAIPAGRHLLTFPLHFSGKRRTVHRYDILLLSQTGDLAAPPAEASTRLPQMISCLSSLMVSAADAPGYVRAAVQGPAHYTLVIRRLDGLNANLPALFLDADRRAEAPPALSNDLSDAEFHAAGVSPAGGAPLADGAQNRDLQRLIDQYAAPARDWNDIAGRAAAQATDVTRVQPQRVVAALLAWRAQQQMPLQAGQVTPAFARYLALRFGPRLEGDRANSDHNDSDRQNGLKTLARRLHTTSQLRLTELADDYLWDMRLRQSLPKDASLPVNEDAQSGVLEQIWTDLARPYWADQEVWQWRGTGGAAPDRMILALDADYAARKTEAVTAALLAANPLASLQSSPAPRPPATPADYSLFLAHNWIDYIFACLPIGLTPGGITLTPDVLPRQSPEALAYIAACRPLIPPSVFAVPQASAVSTKLPIVPLRADELEALAQALLNCDLFSISRIDQDKADAIALLKVIVMQQPDYPKIDRVKSLLLILDPPRGAKRVLPEGSLRPEQDQRQRPSA